MRVVALEIKLYAPWVHSLKEKRMEVKSLTAKIRNKFNTSVAEIDEQDTHQMIVIGVAAVASDTSQADSILEHVLNFIESNSEAEIISAEKEFL